MLDKHPMGEIKLIKTSVKLTQDQHDRIKEHGKQIGIKAKDTIIKKAVDFYLEYHKEGKKDIQLNQAIKECSARPDDEAMKYIFSDFNAYLTLIIIQLNGDKEHTYQALSDISKIPTDQIESICKKLSKHGLVLSKKDTIKRLHKNILFNTVPDYLTKYKPLYTKYSKMLSEKSLLLQNPMWFRLLTPQQCDEAIKNFRNVIDNLFETSINESPDENIYLLEFKVCDVTNRLKLNE